MALRIPYRLAVAAALGASIAVGAVGPVSAAESISAVGSDQQVADAVAKKLAESNGLSGYQVEVTCVGGVVELEGTVKDAKQQAELAKIVRGVKGVRKVDDKTAVCGAIKRVHFDGTTNPPMQGGGMPAGPDRKSNV